MFNHPNTEGDFWSMVDIQGDADCWNWQGHVANSGYGAFGMNNKCDLAHRWAVRFMTGAKVKNKVVYLLCNNKLCCNVDHLRVGTQKDAVNKPGMDVIRARPHAGNRGKPAWNRGVPASPEMKAKLSKMRKMEWQRRKAKGKTK